MYVVAVMSHDPFYITNGRIFALGRKKVKIRLHELMFIQPFHSTRNLEYY